MSIKDIVEEILEKMYRKGYYSEVDALDLKKAFVKHLSKEYRGRLQEETERIESMIDEPSANDYQQAYDSVENHLIQTTKLLAATTKEDLMDL